MDFRQLSLRSTNFLNKPRVLSTSDTAWLNAIPLHPSSISLVVCCNIYCSVPRTLV